MKRNLALASIVFAVGLVSVAHAADGFTALAPIPGLTDAANTSVVNSESLAKFLNNLYMFLIGLAAAIAVVMIIWGGIEYSTQDVPGSKSSGKERIQQALLGLLLILSPVLVFSVINPSILNLSVNLPELDTKSSAPTQTAPTVQAPVRPGSILNAAKVGQKIGFGDGYYANTTPGVYCYPITSFTDTDGAVKNFGCSADPNGCRNMSNGDPASQLPKGAACTKY